jgi:hypothetical protein
MLEVPGSFRGQAAVIACVRLPSQAAGHFSHAVGLSNGDLRANRHDLAFKVVTIDQLQRVDAANPKISLSRTI